MHLLSLEKVIRERRESLQVTQEDLAKISGVGLRTIKQLESGKGNPSLRTLEQITDALGLAVCLKTKNISRKI